MGILGVLKHTLRSAGLEVAFAKTWNDRDTQLGFLLKKHGIRAVIDVGANIGQFGRMLRSEGYKGEIHSFEPTSGAYARLMEAARNDPTWKVYDRMAIGDATGMIEMRIAANSHSSSALAVNSSLSDVVASASTVTRENAPVNRLDDVYFGTTVPMMLKIDTEGYEDRVLAGATQTLKSGTLICCEMQLTPLYEGAGTFGRLFAQLDGAGYRCVGLHSIMANGKQGELLCVDGIFLKP